MIVKLSALGENVAVVLSKNGDEWEVALRVRPKSAALGDWVERDARNAWVSRGDRDACATIFEWLACPV